MVKRAKMPIYALKNLFLGHNTAIKVFFAELYVNLAIYCSILAKIVLFWKIANISAFFKLVVVARAGYLGEYRSDRSEIFRGDSLGYYH